MSGRLPTNRLTKEQFVERTLARLTDGGHAHNLHLLRSTIEFTYDQLHDENYGVAFPDASPEEQAPVVFRPGDKVLVDWLDGGPLRPGVVVDSAGRDLIHDEVPIFLVQDQHELEPRIHHVVPQYLTKVQGQR